MVWAAWISDLPNELRKLSGDPYGGFAGECFGAMLCADESDRAGHVIEAAGIGLVVVVLGAMHFFNMGAIAHFGRTVEGWFEARSTNGIAA